VFTSTAYTLSPALGCELPTRSGQLPAPSTASLHSPSASSAIAMRAGTGRVPIVTTSCEPGESPSQVVAMNPFATVNASPVGVAFPDMSMLHAAHEFTDPAWIPSRRAGLSSDESRRR